MPIFGRTGEEINPNAEEILKEFGHGEKPAVCKSFEATKKSIKNTFVEFKEGSVFPAFVKLQRDAGNDMQYQVWNELHKSWIGVKKGDMLCISKENDVYPVDLKTFFETYDVGQDDDDLGSDDGK